MGVGASPAEPAHGDVRRDADHDVDQRGPRVARDVHDHDQQLPTDIVVMGVMSVAAGLEPDY